MSIRGVVRVFLATLLVLSPVATLYLPWSVAAQTPIAMEVHLDYPPTGSVTEVPWGLEAFLIGLADGADSTYTVNISWGDGSTDPAVPLNDAGFFGLDGPLSHTYASGDVGEIVIDATLFDIDGNPAGTGSLSISVLAHDTTLSLNPIATVFQGEVITVTGSLNDVSIPGPISGVTVTFTGTGATGLPSTTTGAGGTFSSIGLAPAEEGEGWTVVAGVVLGPAYLPPVLIPAVRTFDTMHPSAQTFDVPAGTDVHVPLTGLGASVDFDDVDVAGTLRASECTAPENPKYLSPPSLDMCIKVLPFFTMAPSSRAQVHMSFAGKEIPGGFTESDIHIFRESSGSVTDITVSRNATAVTGNTTSFSKFIGGIPQFPPQADGSKREEVLLGTNEVSFRNVNDNTDPAATIFLDTYYVQGSAATLTIVDPNGNINPGKADKVSAFLSTETSRPDGITVVLAETANNNGVFEGTFTLISGPSSGSSLQFSPGDTIDVSYTQWIGELSAVIEGVTQAGIAEVIDYTITDPTAAGFDQVSGAVELQLVGAQLGSGGKVTVTMSYANADLFGINPSFLRLFHFDGTNWDDITLLGAGGSVIGVDTAAMTVTGETPTLSPFALGFPAGTPGGAGGGLGKPGRGIVLDFAIALAVQRSSNADTLLSVTEQVSRGNNIEVKLTVPGTPSGEGKIITVNFDKVSQGLLTVTERKAAELGNIFESTTPASGQVSAGGSRFTTVGPVYEIDATEVVFSGPVDIALPYDQSLVGSEQNVRFLHHDGRAWQDETVSIDEQANTVTGRVRSLSPVVVGIASDGTFDAAYFALNPLKKVSVLNATLSTAAGPADITHAVKGEQVAVSAVLKNMQRADQTYALIVQVIDESGITRSLSLQEGSLATAQQVEVSSSWTVEEGGRYTIQVFVWDRVEGIPSSLAGATVKSLDAQ